MVRLVGVMCVMVLIAGYAATSFSANASGAPVIDLYGGKKGNVNFPHSVHQTVLGDCSVCHNLFPQKIGGIDEMVKAGTLKSKQAMNECRGCHRTMAKAGKKTGPTSCSKCHVKS